MNIFTLLQHTAMAEELNPNYIITQYLWLMNTRVPTSTVLPSKLRTIYDPRWRCYVAYTTTMCCVSLVCCIKTRSFIWSQNLFLVAPWRNSSMTWMRLCHGSSESTLPRILHLACHTSIPWTSFTVISTLTIVSLERYVSAVFLGLY